jgi:O-antigen/teichoic acid export membrane protein
LLFGLERRFGPRMAILFRQDSFARRVFTLMSGTALAQATTLLVAPLLSRLFRPEDFGLFAMYVTLLSVSAPVIAVRYELAIVPAETDDDALGLVLLSLGISIVLGLVVMIGLEQRSWLHAVGLAPLAGYSLPIALGIVLNGTYQTLLQLKTREQKFRTIARSQLVQSTGAAVVQASTGALVSQSGIALVAGQIVGTIVSCLGMGRSLRDGFRDWKTRHRGSYLQTLKTVAHRYRNHPIFLPWGGFVNALGQKLPVLMLSAFYGPFFLGLYAIADRLLKTPVSLVGQSSSQVFFQKMTERHVKARMPRLILIWAGAMTLFSAVPFTLFYFFSRPLFALILGPKWAPAGDLAAVLIPIYWGGLVVTPISTMLIVANRQKMLLGIQLLFLVAGFGSLWVGHRLFTNGAQTLMLYSIVQCLVYVVYLWGLLSTAKAVAREQAQPSNACVA